MGDGRLLPPERLAFIRGWAERERAGIVLDLARHIQALEDREAQRESDRREVPLALHCGNPVLLLWARQTLAHAIDHPADQPPANPANDLRCPLNAANQAMVDAGQMLPQDLEHCDGRCIRARVLETIGDYCARGIEAAERLRDLVEAAPPGDALAAAVEAAIWAAVALDERQAADRRGGLNPAVVEGEEPWNLRVER